MNRLGMFGPITFRYRRGWYLHTRALRRYQYRYYFAPRAVRWTLPDDCV